MSAGHKSPSYRAESFVCPNCGALAGMKWQHLLASVDTYSPISLSVCYACQKEAIWLNTASLSVRQFGAEREQHFILVYPNETSAPLAEPGMPEFITDDYEEARQVYRCSPRAAAALLRLCVQKLCQHLLRRTKGTIHDQLVELVELGFPSRVLRAFDTIRIFGNESVHPGTLNLNDTPEVALALFKLLNLAVRHCITEEQELEEIRALTPATKRLDI